MVRILVSIQIVVCLFFLLPRYGFWNLELSEISQKNGSVELFENSNRAVRDTERITVFFTELQLEALQNTALSIVSL